MMTRQEEEAKINRQIDRQIASLGRQSRWLLVLSVIVAVAGAVVLALRLTQ